MGVVVCLLVAVLLVLLHYEILTLLSGRITRLVRLHHRLRVLVTLVVVLAAHVLEVQLFAAAYQAMTEAGLGYLQGDFTGSITDYVYFSFTVYSTLGLGDIAPFGSLRLLAGIQSVVGLLLIAWSGSFIFIEMQRYWGLKK